jgi:hypothetical protein
MGLDVFCSRSVLLARGADGYSGGRISSADVYHFPRLHPRILFQVAALKRFFGIHHRSAQVHTLSPLAVGAFRASFQRG